MTHLARISVTLVLLSTRGSLHSPSHPETPATPEGQRSSRPADVFINGRWFDGGRFTSRTMYVVDGLLTTDRPPDP